MQLNFGFSLVVVSLLMAGCSEEIAYVHNDDSHRQENVNLDSQASQDAEANSAEFPSPDFSTKLLAIASDYQRDYSQVVTRAGMAPAYCRAPMPSIAMSMADESSRHSRKLYYLFCSQLDEYAKAATEPSPIGQTVVKQSWEACQIEKDKLTVPSDFENELGRWGKGQQQELFVMFKTPPDTPGTDKGWVYGVVSADGKSVTASGLLMNCMECHQAAGVDRLFGVK